MSKLLFDADAQARANAALYVISMIIGLDKQ